MKMAEMLLSFLLDMLSPKSGIHPRLGFFLDSCNQTALRFFNVMAWEMAEIESSVSVNPPKHLSRLSLHIEILS